MSLEVVPSAADPSRFVVVSKGKRPRAVRDTSPGCDGLQVDANTVAGPFTTKEKAERWITLYAIQAAEEVAAMPHE